MKIINKRKRELTGHGDAVLDADGHLYLLILEEGERYPYHLVSLETYRVLQSFDTIPTVDEIEDEIDCIISEIITTDAIKIVLDE